MRLRRLNPFLVALLVGVSGPAWAQESVYSRLTKGLDVSKLNKQVEEAINDLCNDKNGKNYSKSIDVLKSEGAKGNTSAQFVLGKIYKLGLFGVDKDFDKAISWMDKASESGMSRAQALMAQIYFQEKKYKNPQKALDLATKSAESGDKVGQMALGLIYITGAPKESGDASGQGIPVDAKKAMHWFQKAANQGVAPAQGMLATAYYFGFPGLERNYDKAIEHANLGLAQNDASSCLVLANGYYFGKGVKKDVAKAIEYFKKTAEYDETRKKVREVLGDIYLSGRGVSVDKKEAFKWFSEAQKLGSIEAKAVLGEMYLSGQGIAKDEDKGIKLLKEAANAGHPLAQNKLAFKFIDGTGVPKDVQKGVAMLEKLANTKSFDERPSVYGETVSGTTFNKMKGRFDVLAAYNLGILYRDGTGVKQDYNKSFKWFERAANSGQFLSIANLGVMYLNGRGCEKNADKAFELTLKAAKGGVTLAQYNLHCFYKEGIGTEKDKDKSYYWLEKAAESGDVDAQRKIGEHYLVAVDVKADSDKAFKFLKLASEAGDELAQVDYAVCYLKGIGTKKNVSKGLAILEKMVSKPYVPSKNPRKTIFVYNDGVTVERVLIDDYCPDALASYNLGMIYKNGNGVTQNYKKAKEYFERAIKSGHSLAMGILATMYLDGIGIKKDIKKGIELNKEAAQRGVSYAQYHMYKILYFGIDGKVDRSKAIEWLKKSANSGYSIAQRELGLAYLSGEIKSSDKEAGIRYLKKAVENGDKQAKYRLGSMYCFGGRVEKDLKKGRAMLKELVIAPYKPIENPVSKRIEYFEGGKKEEVQVDDYRPSGMAAFTLAMSYKQRNGDKPDYEKAFHYFDLASKYGNSMAKANLAVLYIEGRGVAQSYEKGIGLCREAAEDGITFACFNLYKIFRNGIGTDKNLDESNKWLKRAADLGNSDAIVDFGDLAARGRVKGYSREDGFKYLKAQAEKGNLDAECSTATCYFRGAGVAKDPKRAASIYKSILEKLKSSKAGDRAGEKSASERKIVKSEPYGAESLSCFNLGLMYRDGVGVEKDLKESELYLTRSANLGYAMAKAILGSFYLSGVGPVRQDFEKGIALTKQAAEMGIGLALYNLGFAYETGSGVSQNLSEAKQWYDRAAKKGHSKAKNAMARLEKQKIEPDSKKAVTAN